MVGTRHRALLWGIALWVAVPLTSYRPPLTAQQPVSAPRHCANLAHTYSIVAYDSATGDLGVAVQS